MKNGQRLSHYDVTDECVLHLVERQDVSQESSARPPTSQSSEETTTSTNTTASRFPGAAHIRIDAMQIDPSADPSTIAQSVAQSLLGSIESFMSGDNRASGSGNTSPFSFFSVGNSPQTSPPGNDANQPRSTPIPIPIHIPTASTLTGRERNNRARSTPRNSDLVSFATSVDGVHQTVRADTRRVLSNLIADLGRLTINSNPSRSLSVPDDAPSNMMPLNSQMSDMAVLANVLGQFEQTYETMAGLCRELRTSLREGEGQGRERERERGGEEGVSWSKVVTFIGLLQELPLLMAVQKRLLMTLNSQGNGARLPAQLDVPSFLNREPSSDDGVEPPE